MAHQITDGNLQEILEKNPAVVIDFWAEWCGPCRALSPVVDELAEEFGEQVFIGKVNVDENDNSALRYGIRTIPTLIFIKNGEVVDKSIGVVPKADLKVKIENLVK